MALKDKVNLVSLMALWSFQALTVSLSIMASYRVNIKQIFLPGGRKHGDEDLELLSVKDYFSVLMCFLSFFKNLDFRGLTNPCFPCLRLMVMSYSQGVNEH